MSDISKKNGENQQFLDARKKLKEQATPQKFSDDDDESGGGNGKRMQGSFKMEKLLGLIGKGKMKAQNFGRFLNKEGLDTSETKKTTLGKQKEQTVKITEKAEKAQEFKENQERAQEIQEDQQLLISEEEQANLASEEEKQAAEAKAEKAWNKAKPVEGASQQQRFGFQEASTSSFDVNNIAEVTRRSISGNRVQGSTAINTGNHLGFIKQVDLTGELSQGKGQDFLGTAKFNSHGSNITNSTSTRTASTFLSSGKTAQSTEVGSTNDPTTMAQKRR